MSTLGKRLLKLLQGQYSRSQLVWHAKNLVGLRTDNAKHFDDFYLQSSDPWHYETSSYENKKYQATLASLPLPHYARVLEVACSIGVFTEQMAKRADFMHAFDLSPTAVKRAAERCRLLPHLHFSVCDLASFQTDTAFDLVLCAEMLYYFPAGYERRITQKLAALTKPDGIVVTVMEAEQGERWRQGFEQHTNMKQTLCLMMPAPERPYEIRHFAYQGKTSST